MIETVHLTDPESIGRVKRRRFRLKRQLVTLGFVGALAALGLPARLDACGPHFPNWLLSGDEILAAPLASFEAEIASLTASPMPHLARPTSRDYQQGILDAELTDLRTALMQLGHPTPTVESIVQAHAVERSKLAGFATAMRNWRENQAWMTASNLPAPAFPGVTVVDGLPGEFADYLRGCIAWHRGHTNEARSAWTALLVRPAPQRKTKSTWAAYMLGRSWETDNPGKAIRFYQQVQALVNAGYGDSDGLAVASIGREARLCYLAGEYQRAIELYLQQQAAGDDAIVSLRWVAAAALNAGPSALKPLARDPTSRRVITAYLIAGGFRDPDADIDGPIGELIARGMEKTKLVSPPTNGWHKLKAPALLWLENIESAGVRNAQEAERFGLAAYQAGRFEQAARWLDLAPLTPATRWLRAKLLLRDGKVREAAAMLSATVRQLPQQPADHSGYIWGDAVLRIQFASASNRLSPDDAIRMKNRALGELGAVRVARREYVEALDALLRSGFWMDAAYVAERVLTVDELKAYVDRNWPQSLPTTNLPEASPPELTDPSFRGLASRIRYLLARRLARQGQLEEARPLFPAEMQTKFQEWLTCRADGNDPQRPKEQRAAALWRAAQFLRQDGMELIGTEVEPDWHIHGGEFTFGVEFTSRTNSVPLQAGEEELRRAQRHGTVPEERFHYRYVAANLAWEAAKLMPDNRDETARVLCIAGSWLKDRDPKAADVFYKALVRRCRKTAVGAEADRKRWFPILDENGNLKSGKPSGAQTSARN